MVRSKISNTCLLSVYNHTTLLINNNNRGPETVTEISDYDNLATNYAVTWFLPEHTDHPFVGQ